MLEIRNLQVCYSLKRGPERLSAVRDVSFSAREGEIVAVVGPSGCGKTSILNVVAGLLPPESGEVLLNGKPVRGPGKDRALVFQEPCLLPWRTVAGNVAYGLEIGGMGKRPAMEKARPYLELVGLGGFGDCFPSELSGGMLQRVNLARALAVEPGVLLLDEPLSALDAQSREYMQTELQRILTARNSTVVYVTHQISEAVFLADRVIVLSSRPGKVKEIVPVPLERPRPFGVQRTAEFRELEDRIWNLLEKPEFINL